MPRGTQTCAVCCKRTSVYYGRDDRNYCKRCIIEVLLDEGIITDRWRKVSGRVKALQERLGQQNDFQSLVDELRE